MGYIISLYEIKSGKIFGLKKFKIKILLKNKTYFLFSLELVVFIK